VAGSKIQSTLLKVPKAISWSPLRPWMTPWYCVISTVARMPVLPGARWLQAEATHWPLSQSPPFAQSCSLAQPPAGGGGGGGGGGVPQAPFVQTRPLAHWPSPVQAWQLPFEQTWPLLQSVLLEQAGGGGGGGGGVVQLPPVQTSPAGHSLSELQKWCVGFWQNPAWQT